MTCTLSFHCTLSFLSHVHFFPSFQTALHPQSKAASERRKVLKWFWRVPRNTYDGLIQIRSKELSEWASKGNTALVQYLTSPLSHWPRKRQMADVRLQSAAWCICFMLPHCWAVPLIRVPSMNCGWCKVCLTAENIYIYSMWHFCACLH